MKTKKHFSLILVVVLALNPLAFAAGNDVTDSNGKTTNHIPALVTSYIYTGSPSAQEIAQLLLEDADNFESNMDAVAASVDVGMVLVKEHGQLAVRLNTEDSLAKQLIEERVRNLESAIQEEANDQNETLAGQQKIVSIVSTVIGAVVGGASLIRFAQVRLPTPIPGTGGPVPLPGPGTGPTVPTVPQTGGVWIGGVQLSGKKALMVLIGGAVGAGAGITLARLYTQVKRSDVVVEKIDLDGTVEKIDRGSGNGSVEKITPNQRPQ